MARSFTMLGQPYVDQRVYGWYVSEKLDGVRALWLPHTKDVPWCDEIATGLWSRDGKVYHAPDWWIDQLPNVPLDGELWTDRGSFQDIVSTVKKHEGTYGWKDVKFMAFDMPVKMEAGIINFRTKDVKIPELRLHPSISKPMIFRVANIVLNRLEHNRNFEVVKQTRLGHPDQLKDMLEEVVEKGGEGLMLRDPDSIWTQARVNTLLKVKPVKTMEVEVTGYYYGAGKYDGMMGALEVAIPHTNRLFKLSGFTDEERKVPSNGMPFSRSLYDDCMFKVGDRIQISYRELTRDGIPKEARYNRS